MLSVFGCAGHGGCRRGKASSSSNHGSPQAQRKVRAKAHGESCKAAAAASEQKPQQDYYSGLGRRMHAVSWWVQAGSIGAASLACPANSSRARLFTSSQALLQALDSAGAYVLLQLPSVDEISAHMGGNKLTTIIFFLDETFEEVSES